MKLELAHLQWSLWPSLVSFGKEVDSLNGVGTGNVILEEKFTEWNKNDCQPLEILYNSSYASTLSRIDCPCFKFMVLINLRYSLWATNIILFWCKLIPRTELEIKRKKFYSIATIKPVMWWFMLLTSQGGGIRDLPFLSIIIENVSCMHTLVDRDHRLAKFICQHYYVYTCPSCLLTLGLEPIKKTISSALVSCSSFMIPFVSFARSNTVLYNIVERINSCMT